MMVARSETVVTLIDGRQVSSWSEEWRHETEARAILELPDKSTRRKHLYGTVNNWGKPQGGVLGRRGQAEVTRLEETMLLIWERLK